MSSNTNIEWTDVTWNPTTGCDQVSAGCDNCYPERLYQPLRWRKPRRIFVNSMSDLFHDAIPDEYIAKVFAVMAAAPHHTFQVLTKRHGRMRSLLNNRDWRSSVYLRESVTDLAGPPRDIPSWPLPNVWLGVSVEDQRWADIRIPALLETPAAVRFLSCEPLLGPVDLSTYLNLAEHIDWVITGGESGPGARPAHPDWFRQLRDQCVGAGIPFLFKQWGAWAPTGWQGIGRPLPGSVYVGGAVDEQGHRVEMARVGKKRAGRELDGRTWDQYPAPSPSTTRLLEA